MTALLEILQEATMLRREADSEWLVALRRASEQHTLRELADTVTAGGWPLSRQGVHYLLRKDREENGK